VVDRLTWKPGPYSSHGGYAGGVHLFGIHYRTVRADPAYFLTTELPGFGRTRQWKHDDIEVLKDKAEKVLDNWLKLVGA